MKVTVDMRDYTSSGSIKNWFTQAKIGTIFITVLPAELVNEYTDDALRFELIEL